MRRTGAVLVLAGGTILGCGGGVTEVKSASGAEVFQAKCKSSLTDCNEEAQEQCHGAYQTLASESHPGGVLADALPGPVTWYTIRFACGAAEDYRSEVDDVIASSSTEIVWPICEVPPRAGKACGLIANKFTDEWVASYAKHICREDGDDPSNDCVGQIVAEFKNDLADRYNLAVVSDVDNACRSVPSNCNTPAKLELLYLASHNDVVFKHEKRRIEEVLARARVDERAADAAHAEFAQENAERTDTGAALAAIGAGFQGFADGWNASRSQQRSPQIEVASNTQCRSDLECGVGKWCAKPSLSSTGTCATVVNQYGVPTYSGPRANSIAPGVGTCSFDTDCHPGFHCAKGTSLRGNCMR